MHVLSDGKKTTWLGLKYQFRSPRLKTELAYFLWKTVGFGKHKKYWKFLQLSHPHLTRQKLMEISPGVLKNIQGEYHWNRSWPFGSLVGCNNVTDHYGKNVKTKLDVFFLRHHASRKRNRQQQSEEVQSGEAKTCHHSRRTWCHCDCYGSISHRHADV